MTAPHAQSPLDWHVRQRWLVLALATVGAVLFVATWFLPWWHFTLIAPQYPKGLHLIISLSGVTGDVQEINTINHYIGMGHIDDAAQLEKALSGYLIGGLAVATTVLALFVGRRLNGLLAAAALAFPLGFLLDTQYWLYRFGHDLDPTAAIDFAPFTPTLIGVGKVGQFSTIAVPNAGFYLALGAVLLVVVAAWQRKKVCASCPARAECEVKCDHGLVRVPR